MRFPKSARRLAHTLALQRPNARQLSSTSSNLLLPWEASIGRNDTFARSIATTTGGFPKGLRLEAAEEPKQEIEEAPIIVDKEVKDFISKIQAINPETVKDDQVAEQVLEDSLKLLLQHSNEDSQIALTQSMQQFLELWISMHFQQHANSPTKTNRPFSIMLQAWRLAAPVYPGAPQEAMAVLLRWYELLAGDIELTPVVADFNQVLDCYAVTAAHAAPLWQQQPQMEESSSELSSSETESITELASSAYDFVQEIHASGTIYQRGSMLESNAHVVKCLSAAIRASAPIAKEHNNVDACKTTWFQLQKIMAQGIQPLADKWSGLKKKKKSAFGFGSSDNNAIAPKELYFLQQALGDALLASRSILTANRLKGLGISLHSEEYGQTPLWKLWGQLFQATLQRQQHPDGELLAFQHLSNSAEAWQHLLQNYDLEMEHKALAVLSQDMLKTMEEVGQQIFADASDVEKRQHHLEVHLTLLRNHYLPAIKQWEYARDPEDSSVEPIPEQDELLHRLEEHHWHLVEQCVDPETNHILIDDSLTEEQQKEHKQRMQQILTASFNGLMQCMYVVGQVDQVESLFQAMKRIDVPRDQLTYGTMLKSFADSTDRNAAPQAMQILQDMHSAWLQDQPGAPQPNKTHYASALVAWSRSDQEKASQRAVQVFHWLVTAMEHHRNNDDNNAALSQDMLRLESIHFSALFTALGSAFAKHRRGKEDPWLENQILMAAKGMIENLPADATDAIACSAAFYALKWVATAEAANIAQHLFDRLRHQYATNKKESMRPTGHLYSTLMHTWARAATKGHVNQFAQQKLEELLLQLEKAFIDSNNDPDLLPNTYIYQALINSITALDTVGAGERADWVLNRMEEKAAQGLADYPGSHMYNRCIEAHRNAKGYHGGEKAEAILEKMKRAYYEEGMDHAKPKLYAYNGVLQAWAACSHPEKASRAHTVFLEVQDLYYNEGDLEMKPSYWVHTNLLQCCAHIPVSADAKQRQEAVRIALQTLVDMEEKAPEQVSSFVYFIVLRAFNQNSTGAERHQLVTAVFEKCAKRGFVNEKVINELKICAPHLHEKLPKVLPPQWSKNVKKRA